MKSSFTKIWSNCFVVVGEKGWNNVSINSENEEFNERDQLKKSNVKISKV